MKRCLKCFEEYDDGINLCPHCGTPEDSVKPAEPIHIHPGSVLHDRYLIGESAGAGGFGIVYKAWDLKLETIVAVKEFYASRLVTRAAGLKEVIVSQKSSGEFNYRKERFLAEAKTMAKFGNHRSIPNVFDFFEENGTAYIVMEFLDGVPLNKYMKQHGGKVDSDLAIMIANEICNALDSLHKQGIVHRDVAPDNVFICQGKEIKIKLMDLGAAKLADETDKVIDIILKPGYSPPEQYDNSKNIGPWTDIYALGATLYAMLTGIKPDESTNRKIDDKVIQPSEIIPDFSENLNNTIMKAMAVDRHMRFKNVGEFTKAINGEKKVISLSGEKKKRKAQRILGIAGAFAVIAAFAGGGIGILNSKVSETTLEPAEINIWYSVENDSTEGEALEEIKNDFTSVFEDVTINITGISSDEYDEKLEEAASRNELPDLFESTDAGQNILDKCIDLNKVTSSEQFESCLFLDQGTFTKQIPLGIEVPVAFIITNGNESLDYKGKYFSELSDFGYEKIAADERVSELCSLNFPSYEFKCGYADFFDNTANKSAVIISSTMKINEFRNVLTNYQKAYSYPENDKIICRYIYKWSIASKTSENTAASERLLSWMLGNVYQNTLTISRCNDGQIPVNQECFRTKTEAKNLNPIADIYDKFIFESEAE